MLDELLGRRVALRHRIAPDGAPGPRFTDAVGNLTSEEPGTVTVHTRTGPVRVARDAIVAVREVPPAPARRASRAAVAELERVRAAAWPAPVREDLGGWVLRAAGGWTKRANSALALGDPGMPVEQALARVQAFAAAHGIAPRVQAPVGSPWSNRVLDAGWQVLPAGDGESLVLVTGVEPVVAAPDWPARPTAAWWAVTGEGPFPAGSPALAVLTGDGPFGVAPPGEQSNAASPVRPREQSKAARAGAPARPGEQSRGVPEVVGFGVLDDPEEGPVAAVRAAVVGDHVHFGRLTVLPRFRRRGLATRLTRAALAWAAARGARHAVVEVATGNPGGRALYAREGWSEHHRSHYLVPGRTEPG
ncbi:GNAT family N-acetyltransferase [Pseudonocardia sp. C8]|uniref:GNAT family N-acetyltransferase n=1 Tax=Pseudonocardia sp. C8 TaxID=2762759 RepID=UPI001642B876|nr:GNAT family N-acetyltransferase [Pseudonocardia sp. C8]MBC3190177.1 GNAT family N-acetyltransferase [Pseudonocardia sp. C8]